MPLDKSFTLARSLSRSSRGVPTLRGFRALGRDTSGAAYVEFLIAFVPMLILFMCVWQFGRILTTRILCKHAAVSAARAAAVVIAEPNDAGIADNLITDDKTQQISLAAYAALAPAIVSDWISSVNVTFPASAGSGGEGTPELGSNAGKFALAPVKMVHVRVVASFRCKLPLADILMCDSAADSGRTFPIVAEASYPYQGARFAYDPPVDPLPADADPNVSNPGTGGGGATGGGTGGRPRNQL